MASNSHTHSDGKFLLVGATGQVGREIIRALQSSGAPAPLVSARKQAPGAVCIELAELSLISEAASVLDPHSLAGVYCVAGMTYVDGCESQPDLAYCVNATGPALLAAYARGRGIPFVYYSTEYVFDGDASHPGPYTEDSKPNPLNVYGKSKLAGEREVMLAHPDALVLRTTVVYGPDSQHKNFVYSLMRTLRAGKTMSVPEDQLSTPTYNRDLVSATLALCDSGAKGVFHVCGSERLNRLEFAHCVADFLGLDADLIRGVSTADLKQTARRPLSAGLDSSRLASMFPAYRIRSIAESLEDCAPELQEFLNYDPTSQPA